MLEEEAARRLARLVASETIAELKSSEPGPHTHSDAGLVNSGPPLASKKYDHQVNPLTKPDMPLLVKVQDAAKMLSVCERTIWKLSASGEIPKVKVGNAVRFRVKDIEDFIEKQSGNN